MMYKEFEEISGCKISYEQYSEIIEPMYMALNMDKIAFCGMIRPTAKVMEQDAKRKREEEAAAKLTNVRVVTAECANGYGYFYFEAEAIRYNEEKGIAVVKPIDWTRGTYTREQPYNCWYQSLGYKDKAKENKDGTLTIKLETVVRQ